MKDRPPSSKGGFYIPPHQRLRSVVTIPSYASSDATPPADTKLRNSPRIASPPHLQNLQRLQLKPKVVNQRDYDDFSQKISDREFESTLRAGADNVDEWKHKLTLLLRNKDKQEVVSREKKDRHDFEEIAALASNMGLYSQVYAKVVVFSKVPLPNYRFDLDDRRPQREVSLPLGLLRRVEAHLGEYLSQKPVFTEVSLTSRFQDPAAMVV